MNEIRADHTAQGSEQCHSWMYAKIARDKLIPETLIVVSESKKIAEKHPQLILSTDKKVNSHIQREDGEWIINTLMIEGADVPFIYKRKKRYKCLKGSRVNLTYYPEIRKVGSLEIETMKVVSVKRA